MQGFHRQSTDPWGDSSLLWQSSIPAIPVDVVDHTEEEALLGLLLEEAIRQAGKAWEIPRSKRLGRSMSRTAQADTNISTCPVSGDSSQGTI